MRAIPPSFDMDTVSAIDGRLDAIVAGGVAITLAVESGSRAWGFASPDSDYDCRFLFVRPSHGYLTLWPKRDVIETPLDGLLDVSGWDVGKALKLVVGGNAVAIEWLRSPVVYRAEAGFVQRLTDFADTFAPLATVRHHYRHLAVRQLALPREKRAMKKIFYALRPAAALRWMRIHPGLLPPMHLPALIDGIDLAPAVRAEIDRLLEAKAQTRELGEALMPQILADLIEHEIDATEQATAIERPGALEAADTLFREFVMTYAFDRRGFRP
ncbi:MAG TPA: nucleotidyltransferase domain-containing protein [Sphingomonas sp.]|jgi:hypothetical protein